MRISKAVTAGGLAWFSLLVLTGPLLPQEKTKDTPFFPLKVGTVWVYRDGSEKVTVRVLRHEAVGEVRCAVLQTTRGDVTTTEHVATQPDGVYRYQADREVLTIPICLLKLPAALGTSWQVSSTAAGLEVTGTFTLGAEVVTVPAGKFKTVTAVSKDLRVGASKMTMTTWFAPNVGMVKQEVWIGDLHFVLELEKVVVPQ
jgi:hypothetical protein